LAALVAACQNSASDEILIEKAQHTAAMPDCASLRLVDAMQGRFSEGLYRVSADFAASGHCLESWRRRLKRDGWRMDVHGSWSRASINVNVSPKDNVGSVTWYQNRLQPDVRDITTELDIYQRKGWRVD
jgi:hypothetical protein